MLIKEGGFPNINAIGIVKGSFKCAPGDYSSLAVDLLAVYVNHPSGHTFGTCPLQGMAMSEDTLNKLGDFLRSAEKDFSLKLQDVSKRSSHDTSINDTFPE